jgi:hypothetical protein
MDEESVASRRSRRISCGLQEAGGGLREWRSRCRRRRRMDRSHRWDRRRPPLDEVAAAAAAAGLSPSAPLAVAISTDLDASLYRGD